MAWFKIHRDPERWRGECQRCTWETADLEWSEVLNRCLDHRPQCGRVFGYMRPSSFTHGGDSANPMIVGTDTMYSTAATTASSWRERDTG